MEKKLFSWSTKVSDKTGRTLKIRLDIDGNQIPRDEWESYEFVEMGKEPPPPPPVNDFTYTIGVELLLKKHDNTILKLGLNGLPYCCGLCEMGNIAEYNLLEEIKDSDFFKTTLDKMLKEMLSTKFTNSENNRVRSIIIALKDHHGYLKESFERTGDFVMIKEFINDNTGNNLTTWISTN